MVESSKAITRNSMEMESPSRFSVHQVGEQDGQRYMHVEDMQEEKEDCVFAGRHRVGGWGQGRPEYMLKQYLMY